MTAIELIDDHVHVLAEEEQRPLHARVLGVEAGHEFALGLGQVERRAVGLGERGDHEDHERQHQVPVEDAPRRQRDIVPGIR